MNKYLREVIWFLSPILLAFIAFSIYFYSKPENQESLVINIHDTYFVITNTVIFIFLSLIFLLITYTTRLLYVFRYNKYIALVPIILNIAVILGLTHIYYMDIYWSVTDFNAMKIDYLFCEPDYILALQATLLFCLCVLVHFTTKRFKK